MLQSQPIVFNEQHVLFVGNITQDTVITFEKKHLEQEGNLEGESSAPSSDLYANHRKIVNKSLGGSVMFGCLAFQHYVKTSTNTKIHPKIITKIGKQDVNV